MNDKKAKRVRAVVRRMLKGSDLPERQLLRNIRTGQIVNDVKSFRGLYRFYKKEIRHGTQLGTNLARVEGSPQG